jgi:2,5-dihydroxypyridine 5,6-dioxygenase
MYYMLLYNTTKEVAMSIQLSDLMPGVMNCATNVARIKPGEDVLIISDTTSDKDVVDAYKIAYEIAGGHVSVLTLKSAGAGGSSEEITRKALYGFWPKIAFHAMVGADLCINLTAFTDIHGIFGSGATHYGLTPPDLFNKYKTRMLSVAIANKEALASDWATYPQPLLRYLSYKAHQQLLKAVGSAIDSALVKVTDPQGTDLSFRGFTMCTKADNDNSDKNLPFYAFGTEVVGMIPFEPVANAEGVIVSTSIHTGYIPRIEATVSGGRIVSLEGGGEVGKAWMRDWEKGKDASSKGRTAIFGELKDPGINWFEEMMYGVHPKAFRIGYKYRYEGSDAFHAWVGGTRRSGVVHFGIGGGKDEWYRHRDFEVFFPTLTINDEPIIQNGRLLILDDPEVREEAAKYADPDELLTEKWIPEMPPAD